jgi:hypothetical protein
VRNECLIDNGREAAAPAAGGRLDRAARPGGNPAIYRRRPDVRSGRFRLVLFLAMLLVFSWQSVVAETHNHFTADSVQSAAANHASAVNPDGSNKPSKSPANCPICRELANTASYLPPPAPAVFFTAALRIAPPDGAPRPSFATSPRSHGWQSRAPPPQLQT